MNTIGTLPPSTSSAEFDGRFALDPAWTRQLSLVVFLQDTRSLAVAGVAVRQLR